MDVAILVSVLGVSFLIIICAIGMGSHLLNVINRLDKIIDLLQKERTANARRRVGM